MGTKPVLGYGGGKFTFKLGVVEEGRRQELHGRVNTVTEGGGLTQLRKGEKPNPEGGGGKSCRFDLRGRKGSIRFHQPSRLAFLWETKDGLPGKDKRNLHGNFPGEIRGLDDERVPDQ